LPTHRSSFFLVFAEASVWIPVDGGGFEGLWIRISATKPLINANKGFTWVQ